MKLFNNTQLKALDAYTIEHEPVASFDLMERAARAISDRIKTYVTSQTPLVVFAGPGNNGGDALAVARMLLTDGYDVVVYLFNPKGSLSPDCEMNFELLKELASDRLYAITTHFTPLELTARHVIIDGLFGTGLTRPLDGGFAAVVRYINSTPAKVIAIDIPSGLMPEDNSANNMNAIVRADITLSLQLPKLAFLLPDNAAYVGEWQVLDIGLSAEGMQVLPSDYFYTELADLAGLVRPRPKFAHKGSFGHGLLIAGRQGMAGSSVLAAQACMRSGIGLLTVGAPLCNVPILQVAVPEAMVAVDPQTTCFSTVLDDEHHQAIAIGPGLGQAPETADAVIEQIRRCRRPMVIDADALNILAFFREALEFLPESSILTPHPKELERIVGECNNDYERLSRASELAGLHRVYVVLKGAYTAVCSPAGEVFFNSTGNQGMATGGSGDVLTGILLALLAQGYSPLEAARLGVYVHGRAGDLAAEQYGQLAMKAGDIIAHLPAAWMEMVCNV